MRSRPDRRPFGPGPFLVGARVKPEFEPLEDEYPFLPVVHDLQRLRTDCEITMLVGENGSGKSTLIEALAIAAGFGPQGGPLSSELGWVARESESELADMLEIERGRYRPRSGLFLRAESFFNIAARIDAKDLSEVYGGAGLHAQSHGESFLALAANRFGSDGLFILDEPEAALSVQSQLALIAVMRRAVSDGSQFILATHSPILLSYPGARVYETRANGLEQIPPEDTDPVRLTREFLNAPDRFLRHVFEEDGS